MKERKKLISVLDDSPSMNENFVEHNNYVDTHLKNFLHWIKLTWLLRYYRQID
jgi:hypothetical protein